MNKEKVVLESDDLIKGIVNKSIDGILVAIADIDDKLGVGFIPSSRQPDKYTNVDIMGIIAYQLIKGLMNEDIECQIFGNKMTQQYIKENTPQENK